MGLRLSVVPQEKTAQKRPARKTAKAASARKRAA